MKVELFLIKNIQMVHLEELYLVKKSMIWVGCQESN